MNNKSEAFEFVYPKKDGLATTIKKSVLCRLESLGNMNSSYDDVISDLLEHCDRCDRFWENRT